MAAMTRRDFWIAALVAIGLLVAAILFLFRYEAVSCSQPNLRHAHCAVLDRWTGRVTAEPLY